MEEIKVKADLSENGSRIQKNIDAQKKKEKKLFPLRIDERTVIYVTKAKCTQKYAESYRKRIGQESVKLGGRG